MTARSWLRARPNAMFAAIGVYVVCVVFGWCAMALFVAAWLG